MKSILRPEGFLKGIFVVFLIAEVSCSRAGDIYLRTLHVGSEYLAVTDSMNIDQFDLFQAGGAVAADNGWVLLSAVQGDYNLLFLDPDTKEHFFAIRKGRGPGEMIRGDNLHRNGGDVLFYDYSSAVCVSVNMSASIDKHSAVMDTAGVFSSGMSRPVYMTSCGVDGFISGNLLDDDVWYSYYNSTGDILSNVESLDLRGLSDDRDYRMSFNLSSKYAASPDGTKVCVASVMSPSVSFSNVYSGILTEYKRIGIAPVGMKGGHVTEESASAFNGMCADEDYVYLLYSGRRIVNSTVPTDECEHLVIYDWAGDIVRHFILEKSINSIDVYNGCVYGTSLYPESCLYVFQLPEL